MLADPTPIEIELAIADVTDAAAVLEVVMDSVRREETGAVAALLGVKLPKGYELRMPTTVEDRAVTVAVYACLTAAAALRRAFHGNEVEEKAA